ncbi:hypothetical protein QOL99_15680 [Deinococcus sp. MIMF12]|uniref:DoxX family protein n=1 Tax=Deinococcus rhizophilus TaxID=3049544 RepID=A0ABT7JKL5_9DEIO|nr:hypothetical protein [Deinococcus rhizophilus]MDL2345577.1 hypothetical protein [Deinococcus rhizophilus]
MTSPPAPAPSAALPSPRWSAWRRLVLRAGTLYLALYFLIGGQPLLGTGFGAQRVAAADGLHGLLFGRPLPPYTMTGSGDTAFDWTFLLLVLGLAILGGLVWTLAGRRDPSPASLHRLGDGLRVVLILWLTVYALAKFNFGQFGLLHPGQLLTTYGESSPMGLLWRFMAASPGYQYVAGVAELLPALLLLHRRTVTLGALVAAVTMTNVLALNLLYDVPVKLFSAHLLLAALVLLALDGQRLWAFATGRAFAARTAVPSSRWEAPTAWVVTVLLLGGAVASGLSGLPRLQEARQEAAQQGDLLRTRGFHWVNERPFNR